MLVRVAIVDYGMGNLFSVARACERTGFDPVITSDPEAIRKYPAIILPGVGAFPDAIDALTKTGVGEALAESAKAGQGILGVCLGMQLLMEQSEENTEKSGLSIIGGQVLDLKRESSRKIRTPHVGWNWVRPTGSGSASPLFSWFESPRFMYFVHSFFVSPASEGDALTTTRYADIDFCSAIGRDNVLGCQFHPERSGADGLRIYDGFRRFVETGI